MPRKPGLRTINRIRATVNEYLTDSCDIETQAPQSTGSMGQPIRNWLVVSSGVSCRVIRAGSSQSNAGVQASQEVLEDSVRIILPEGTVVAVDNRIVLSSGASYQVVAISDSLSDSAFVDVTGKRLR